MADLIRFPRLRWRRRSYKCDRCNTKLTPSHATLPSSKRSDKAVEVANVFQELALENRHALETLEKLAKQILAETRRLSAKALTESH